ncbi:MAG: ABC transporter ATP-binding protein [Pirellulaceae bacterium]|nr:ABC transporter ATP-binding protein [Pirellulaceae bacterium]
MRFAHSYGARDAQSGGGRGLNAINDSWDQIPYDLRAAAESRLDVGESPLAWLELDLDNRLHFSAGLIVLTARHLLAIEQAGMPQDESSVSGKIAVRSWPLNEIAAIRAKEQGGVGRLELLGATELLGHWRFTIGRAAAAHRIANRFESLRRGKTTGENEGEESVPTVCPSCGALLAADQGTCPDCDMAQAKPPVSSLFRLIGFVKTRKWMVLIGLALMVASGSVSLVPTYLTIPLIGNILKPAESGENFHFSQSLWYLLGFFVAAILAWLFSWARTFVLARVGERIAVDLRNNTYSHMQRLSVEFFGGKRTGDLIARVSTDTDRICYYLTVYLLDFANDLLLFILTAAILFYLDPWLTVATFIPLPVIAYCVHLVRSRLRRGFAVGTRAWGEMTSVLADTIPGIRVVKAFAQEKREIDRFKASNDRVLRANDRVNNVWTFFQPAVALLTSLGLLIIWGYGSWQIINHQGLRVEVLIGFIQYITRLYGRMDSMSRIVAATHRAGASAQRIFAILDRVPSVAEPVKPVHPGRLSGQIELRRVGFHYGSRPVLSEIDLCVSPGEMIGLVGPSGSGKTTLVNLVCRFYDVTEGAILADGTDIRSFSIAEYRRHIGIVLQEPFLFYGTIAENIAYGRPDASRTEIIDAARAARAHEFILRLPDAYDSMVGERGQFLSGGERQRISIARALLIDPRILILDEATSSVDTETEREIQLALENLVKGRTTIAIAHRLSTLRRANRLVVIERGRITEIGHHDDLLRKDGTYARLHQAQFEMNREQ